LLAHIIKNSLEGKRVDYNLLIEKLDELHLGYLDTFIKSSLAFYLSHEFGHAILDYTIIDNRGNNAIQEYIDAGNFVVDHPLVNDPSFIDICQNIEQLSLRSWANELSADHLGLKLFLSINTGDYENLRKIKFWSIYQSVFFLYPLQYRSWLKEFKIKTLTLRFLGVYVVA